MSRRAIIIIIVVLAAAVTLSYLWLGHTGPTQAARADILPVPAVAGGEDPLAPAAAVWGGITPIQVPLSGMDIKGEWPVAITTSLEVQALRRGDWLYWRVSWADTTADSRIQDITQFADAVAVQVPVEAAQRPYICMGQGTGPVNIIYWRADTNQAESLVGGAYGTLSRYPLVEAKGQGSYQNGRWTVVLARALGQDPAWQVPQASIAFAVWNGADEQRGGRKSTSNWLTLDLRAGGQVTASRNEVASRPVARSHIPRRWR
ncbi:MAG: DMSO reductase [Clostridia bacterium]|nr:MAG: DMSO reductase [Clostridia bacterium]